MLASSNNERDTGFPLSTQRFIHLPVSTDPSEVLFLFFPSLSPSSLTYCIFVPFVEVYTSPFLSIYLWKLILLYQSARKKEGDFIPIECLSRSSGSQDQGYFICLLLKLNMPKSVDRLLYFSPPITLSPTHGPRPGFLTGAHSPIWKEFNWNP